MSQLEHLDEIAREAWAQQLGRALPEGANMLNPASAHSRSQACVRICELLDASQDPAFADSDTRAWLARLLSEEADTWRRVARSREREAACEAAPDDVAYTPRPLTPRMVETLTDMREGALVESEPYFSWPRWNWGTRPRFSSRACPTRAILEGLHRRGMLAVQEERRRWVSTINAAGREALATIEAASAARRKTGRL